jgi:hypothetical protein
VTTFCEFSVIFIVFRREKEIDTSSRGRESIIYHVVVLFHKMKMAAAKTIYSDYVLLDCSDVVMFNRRKE